MRTAGSIATLIIFLAAAGCEEHVVRRTEYGASTPFGASNVPSQTQAKSNAKANPQLSTDWRGTPKKNGQTLGQPLVPSGSASTR